jgi:hypothetical protein
MGLKQSIRQVQIAVRLSAEQKGSEKKSQPFKSLLKALQHACHRDLVELMDFIRHKNGDEDKIGPSEEEDDPLWDAEAIEKWTSWRETLKNDNK